MDSLYVLKYSKRSTCFLAYRFKLGRDRELHTCVLKEIGMGDHIGQQLGSYRLLRLLGQGGFADVYLGEHIHLGTQAAIKVLQVRLVESNIQNFLNEARTIAHLVHPYIIRVLDFGVQNEIPFLVMDYAPKGTFRQRFLQGRPLPAAPLVPFFKQAAAALQYGHDKQLIHRDVKPENMLLGPNDEVLLSDFGLAVIAHNSISPSPTETAGTAAYMAPEQLQGRPRQASDQYALGIIAYEWLSGSCPFQGSFFEIASQQVLAPPPSLREKVPTIAPEVVKVVMTALEKNPLQRFPSVRDFALALEEACLTSKQYAFNLPIANQPIAGANNDMPGAIFPPLDQHSLDHLPLYAANKAPFNEGAQEIQRSFSFNTPLQFGEHDKQMQQAEALAAQRQTQHRSMGGTRSFTYKEGEQAQPSSMVSARFPVPGQRSQANFPDLSQMSPASIPGQSPQQEFTSRSLSFAFPPEARQQAPALDALTNMPLPRGARPLSQTSIAGNQPLDALSPAAYTAEKQLSLAAFPPLPSPPMANNTAQRNQVQDAVPVLTPRTPPTTNTLFRPKTVIIIGLVLLLIVGAGAGISFYAAHNANSKAPQTTNSNQSPQKPTPKATPKATGPATQAVGKVANPYPPHTGTFVMNDALTSNKYGWQEKTVPATGGSCQFVTGGYEAYSPIIDPTPCFATRTSFTNFTYQVDMKFVSIGQSYSGGGIVFRGDSTSGKYYYFEIYGSGKYSLQVCDTGNCTLQLAGYKLENVVPAAFRPGLGVTNTLAVVAVGNTFDLYLNNQIVKEVTDTSSTYTQGALGVLATGGNNNNLRVAATSTPARVVFSNAKVWKL